MKRSRNLWARTGAATLVTLAMAATAALAYERAAVPARATVLADAQEADPGIDFMITGPVTSSKTKPATPKMSSAQADKPPVRHRMRLD